MIDSSSYLLNPTIGTNNINTTNVNNISYFWKFLLLIGIYYLLPSLQFVFFQSSDSNVQCYYNFKCKHIVGNIPSFNNFISNILYIFYGLLFLIIISFYGKRDEGISSLGINRNNDLFRSLGLTLILEGVCSALYHICPSKLNFQFDTTFMFVGTTLMFITMFSKRHPPPSPIKTYSFLSLVVLINILPLSGITDGIDMWFWILTLLFISYIMIFGSIYIYYGKEYDIDIKSFILLKNSICNIHQKDIPKIFLIVAINAFTIGMLIYAFIEKPYFTTWMLAIFIINMSIYFNYYIINKLKNKEYISPIFWIFLVLDIFILSMAIYFFMDSVTDITLSIEDSNKLNKPCVLLNYFDYHDIWHILSATGLFIFMNLVYFLDSNLDDKVYEELAVF